MKPVYCSDISGHSANASSIKYPAARSSIKIRTFFPVFEKFIIGFISVICSSFFSIFLKSFCILMQFIKESPAIAINTMELKALIAINNRFLNRKRIKMTVPKSTAEFIKNIIIDGLKLLCSVNTNSGDTFP